MPLGSLHYFSLHKLLRRPPTHPPTHPPTRPCPAACPYPRVRWYVSSLGSEDAIHTALLTLKEGFEGQISGDNVEIGIVGEDRKFRVLSSSEVADYLSEVE